MGNPNDFTYLISAWSSLPYRENYVDQYVKTMQSDVFHYCKLNCAKIIILQQMIFQYNILKCITYIFLLYFGNTGTVCLWWNKPPGIIHIYLINSQLNKLTWVHINMIKVYLQHSNNIYIVSKIWTHLPNCKRIVPTSHEFRPNLRMTSPRILNVVRGNLTLQYDHKSWCQRSRGPHGDWHSPSNGKCKTLQISSKMWYIFFNPRPLRPKGYCRHLRLSVCPSVCLFPSSLLTQ